MEEKASLTKKTKPHLEQKRDRLLERRDRLLKEFSEVAQSGRRSRRLGSLFERINRTNEFLKALNTIEKEIRPPEAAGRCRYAVSSLFLHQCFKDLTADANEQFFFITGSVVGGVHVLDQKAEFEHQRRTAVGVVGQPGATHKLLIKLEQFGHRLLGSFHSHPGKGPGATRPSGTDENFQRRLETGGHLAVAAVFSRDGYVRFFRMDKEPEIEIYGAGVEKHGSNVYRLTNIGQA